jgi:hypothetical protein
MKVAEYSAGSFKMSLAHKSVQHYTSTAKLDEGSRIVSWGRRNPGPCFFKALLGIPTVCAVSNSLGTL